MLDSLMVAEVCYQSREYHRALMYLEQHMASSNKGLSEPTEGGLLAVCNVLRFDTMDIQCILFHFSNKIFLL